MIAEAVGRRRASTSSAQFPGFRWAEWNGRYRDACADSCAAKPGCSARSRRGIAGSSDFYAARGQGAREQHQLRHLPRRLHAVGPRELRQQAQRGERRAEPRRPRRQLQLELRRRRATPTTPRTSAARRSARATAVALLFLSQGVPMLLGRRRSCCARSRATTTRTARTTTSSWLDWSFTPAARRCCASRAR